jgi:hypothetical protein
VCVARLWDGPVRGTIPDDSQHPIPPLLVPASPALSPPRRADTTPTPYAPPAGMIPTYSTSPAGPRTMMQPIVGLHGATPEESPILSSSGGPQLQELAENYGPLGAPVLRTDRGTAAPISVPDPSDISTLAPEPASSASSSSFTMAHKAYGWDPEAQKL